MIRRWSKSWIALAAVVVLLVAVVLWQRRPRPGDAGPGPAPLPAPPALTAAEIEELVRLKTRGIAQLENNLPTEGAETFQDLSQRLRDDPAPRRNMVLGRLLALEGLDRQTATDAFAAAARAAEEALSDLASLAREEAVTLRLEARIARALGDELRAVAALRRAAARDPDDASLWYELYQLAQSSRAPDASEIARQALERAAELAPQNLFVLLDWLLAQAQQDPAGIPARLDAAQPLLESVADGVRRRVGIELPPLIAQLRAAAVAGDRAAALRSTRMLVNVVRPDDVAQSDRMQVERHALEFLALQLACEANAPPAPVSRGAWQVRWRRADLGDLLSEATDVLDAAWGDLDLDQRLDLVVLRGGRVEAYRRPAPAGEWQRFLEADVPPGLTRLRLADLDQDVDAAPQDRAADAGEPCHRADLDLVLFGPGGLRLLRNQFSPQDGGRRWEPVEAPPDLGADRPVRSVAAADVNSDGDLDLVVVDDAAVQWWSNRGDFQFEPHDFTVALPPGVLQALPLDWDRDVDCDVVVVCESGACGLLENLRHGTFRWQPWDLPAGNIADVRSGIVLEADGNQSWDLLLSGAGGTSLLTTQTPLPGRVQLRPLVGVDQSPADGVVEGDLDNDGSSDLVLWSAAGLRILRGDSAGRWAAPSDSLPPDVHSPVRSCALADVDGDGDLDLLVVAGGGLQLFWNDLEGESGWLDVAVVAQQVQGERSVNSGRVNHYGVGSVLEVRDGLRYQARLVQEAATHFGLGTGRPDALRILWTNGVPGNVLSPAPRTTICERQSLKGSCPYLYAWNGERFEFVTDLLWAAPLGLQGADGHLVPCREWEYLKVPGAALQAVGGEYRLAITEELWEAAYLDHVELMAVDHPVGLSIYSNEKVGPAELAQFHIHTVREPRTPAAARDGYGRDLRPLIAVQDERYARPFQRRLRQGLTEPSVLELELGLTERPRRLRLFLTGWIHPTDATINVALAEDPALEGPRPPSLAVPNDQGEFETVLPFFGFPGGKTKTIVVELTDVLRPDDDRLRIETTQELAWDQIFFTTEEDEPESLRVQPLELKGATLRYRGFSRPIPHPHGGPERYDYDDVTTIPQWPAMKGRFTRYGDVQELLAAADDRLVLMGAGDELLLRFAALPPPPEGWTRDFLLHNVGWDKDADLHTVHGQTVEPLPFAGMSRYPYPPEEAVSRAPQQTADAERFHTREQSARPFLRATMWATSPP